MSRKLESTDFEAQNIEFIDEDGPLTKILKINLRYPYTTWKYFEDVLKDDIKVLRIA